MGLQFSASYKASVNEKFTVKEPFPHMRHKVGDINDDQNKVIFFIDTRKVIQKPENLK